MAALAIQTSSAGTQSLGTMPSAMPIGELKRVYLDCERAVLAGGLGGGGIMQCSIVYEELKRRAFSGDFQRLKAWSDQQLKQPRTSHATVRSA